MEHHSFFNFWACVKPYQYKAEVWGNPNAEPGFEKEAKKGPVRFGVQGEDVMGPLFWGSPGPGTRRYKQRLVWDQGVS